MSLNPREKWTVVYKNSTATKCNSAVFQNVGWGDQQPGIFTEISVALLDTDLQKKKKKKKQAGNNYTRQHESQLWGVWGGKTSPCRLSLLPTHECNQASLWCGLCQCSNTCSRVNGGTVGAEKSINTQLNMCMKPTWHVSVILSKRLSVTRPSMNFPCSYFTLWKSHKVYSRSYQWPKWMGQPHYSMCIQVQLEYI